MLKLKRTSRWFGIAVTVSALWGGGMIGLGQVAPAQPELPSLDKRVKGAVLSPAQENGATQLRARIPAVRIDMDEVLGSPAWVMSTAGFLSGPASEEEMNPRTAQTLPNPSNDDRHRAIKAFLTENVSLFGHASEVLTNNARIKDDYVTPHNGMRSVVWEQQLDGIPVFEGLLIGHITRNGELVNLSSHFVPNVVAASQMDSTRRAALEASPPISPQQAVANAATNIGETLRVEDVIAASVVQQGPEKRLSFTAAPLLGEALARLVWLPVNRTLIRLCWSVELVGNSRGEMFRVLIDAQSGEALVRHCLTAYQSQASSYRVFTSDSPSPFSPGWQAPSSAQPPLLGPTPLHGRQLVAISPSTISPNGWINDGNNETLGNNVDAHLDSVWPWDVPELPRPNGGTDPGRLFEFDLDLGQEPTVEQTGAFNQSVAVVNLFYWCNWMHDRLYELGFTEAARNFQTDNFGRGGIGNDAVQADAQDSAAFPNPPYWRLRNNSNFDPPSEGSGLSPRMQMYLFDGPTPDRDGDLDAEIILHEYTHGLSNRRVGGGVGIDWRGRPQAGALGEGWSDFYALALLREETDEIHAKYAMGGYVTHQFLGADCSFFNENYYYGIRRYPYTTDMGEIDLVNNNPLTFRDIDPSQDNPHPGVSLSPLVGCALSSDAGEVHNAGEVWCVTLWEARANLIQRYGWQVGNQLILQLVTDGMNLSPANPNFIQARDAILLADHVNTGGANLNELWAAFARRGMGWGAIAPASSTTVGVVETFALPPQGNQVWSYTTGNAIYSSPAIGADGTLYIGSTDGYLYAINSNGSLRWSFTEPAPYISFNAAPVVAGDGTIYARRNNGYLYALNPNGTLRWKTQIYYDTWASPSLGPDGTIYVAGLNPATGYANCVHAIRPSDGAILCSFNAGNTIYSGPVVAPDGTIYFGSTDTKVYAVDPNTHQLKPGWPVVTGGWVISSPAIGRDGTIYVGSYDGKLYALNPNGTHKWPPVFLGTGDIDSSPAIGPDGTVYVGSGNGKLYALSGVSGLARSSWPMFRHNPWHTGNPATLTLASGVRLGDADFQFQVLGLSGMNCTVEGSDNLESWSTLGSVTLPAGGSATFTDTQASGYPPHRFYRASSGAILSYNSLGYLVVNVPSGDSMIANQLDNPAGNTVGVLLPNPPDGTTLYKWNEGAQQFVINSFESGDEGGFFWSDPNMTLNPGEGALIQPGAPTTFTFLADLRQGTLATPYPSNVSMRSSMVPQTGPLDTALGFQPVQGDRIDRMNNAAGAYDTYVFFAGGWFPTVPIPRVGESFWVSGTGSTWTRAFLIW